MTGLIFNKPVKRATPWVRWVAQNDNPIRIMRCFHCCKKQVVDYRNGLAAAAKDERAFARAHASCAPPAREHRPRIAAGIYDLTQGALRTMMAAAGAKVAS